MIRRTIVVNGEIIGYIAVCEHGSFFIQRKRVAYMSRVKYGINHAHHIEIPDARVRA
jgi:hypothetical protein